MIRPINVLPDNKEILHTSCQEVLTMTPEIIDLIKDLADTAEHHKKNCVGLAANQIWKQDTPAPRIFVARSIDGWTVFINPIITKRWNKEIKDIESCMSIPGYKTKVTRSRHIQVSFFDQELKKIDNLDFFDFPARIVQHEVDHLDGKLIL